MKNTARITALLLPTLFAATVSAAAADLWVGALDPAVVTNNNCGFISAVNGAPRIRRSFHSDRDDGNEAYVADRIHSGDELEVPPGGRLEWVSGDNIVVVLGENGLARLEGLRLFADAEGRRTTRLDVQLLRGEMRVQVRRNAERPSAVLVALNGADVLITQGDVELYSNDGWRTTALAGEAAARIRRGGVAGAPFTVVPGTRVGANGPEMPEKNEEAAIKARLPFSFEQIRAALPPSPVMGADAEAP